MPANYKVLGQAMPVNNTFTDLYTVPAGANAIVSTISLCNTTTSNVSFRLAVRPAGATLLARHYIAYEAPITGQDAIALSLGLTLGQTDVLTGFSIQGNVAMSLFGTEIT
jgi:hypothetical protein